MDAALSSVAPRIRVLLVGPSLGILGGQSVQLRRLLERFEEMPELEAAFLAVNPVLPGPLAVLQRIRFVRTIVTSLAYVVTLLRTVPRYDVIHAFSASYWSFVLAPLPALLVGRLFGKRIVLNYHSGEAADHLSRWRRTAIPAMRLAHAIVVPSAYLVEVFGSFGLHAIAVHNFVEVARFPYRERTRPQPVFLSNRNLQPLYNVACIIRAFARLAGEARGARLIIAGFGSERPRLEAMVRDLGVSGVEFRGKVSPEEMAALYDEADVYLNSPNIDNMPLSVLEAFAAGLPVATTDAGGIPWLVRDGVTGLLVPRDDDAALARAAARLLKEDGLAARLATAARQQVMETCTWPVVRRQWLDLYRHLVSPPTTARAHVVS